MDPGGRSRRLWAVGVLVAALALAAIVAVAADGEPLRGPTAGDDARLVFPVQELLTVVIVLAAAFGAVVVVVALSAEPSRRGAPPRRRGGLLRSLAAMGLVLLVVYGLSNLRGGEREAPPEPPPAAGAATDEGRPPERAAPLWPMVALALLAGSALGLAAVASRRTSRGPRPGDRPEAPARPEEQVRLAGEAFDASIDELRHEPDPRRAVVRAYARLLDGLDRAGLGRHPDEAPEEHLGRALHHLDVAPGPLRRLTALFAEARFSTHLVGPAHKDDAIDALVAARRSLTARMPA